MNAGRSLGMLVPKGGGWVDRSWEGGDEAKSTLEAVAIETGQEQKS